MRVQTTSIRAARTVRHYGNRALKKFIAVAGPRLMGTITHVATCDPVAALTFDDGPHPAYTPCLLDILERHGARATFFMIGRQARQHPDIVRRAVQRGHAIANHTQDHPLFLTLSGRDRRRQIRACAQSLAPYGLPFFRPPKGHQSFWSRLDILLAGCQAVTWSMHAEDWLVHEATWIADRLEQQLRPGSIMLLHDAIWDPMVEGASNREPVLEAVDLLLQRTRDRFRFITVPELLDHGSAVRENWYKSPR
jgi:peptidoglycan-N-acetylglucosamine deacetylase